MDAARLPPHYRAAADDRDELRLCATGAFSKACLDEGMIRAQGRELELTDRQRVDSLASLILRS